MSIDRALGRRTFGGSLAACAFAASFGGARLALGAAPADARAIAADAFIYAFPMLMNYKTLFQQAVDPAFPGYVGGFNRYRHYARGFTPADRDIVTPNNDTPYSWAWFDLRAEPVVLSVPASPERYYVVQLMDLYTHNFAYVGSRATGPDAGDYLLAGPGWRGEPPPGIQTVLRPETSFALTLTRTAWTGPEELEAVRAMQRRYLITPLSEHTATKPPVPAPELSFPAWDEPRAISIEFVAYLNFLLQFCAPVEAERGLLARFATIGIGPGRPFDPATLDPALRSDLEAGVEEGQRRLKQRIAQATSSTGLFGSREALGDDYLMRRAAGAAMGIYGNSVEEAVYIGTHDDADGRPLDGARRYTLRFAREDLPEVEFFWSATVYALPSRLLVENPIDRYSLGSRSKDLVHGEDGSLTIHVQASSPGADQKANWLPSPAEGPFDIVLRLYGPSPEIQSGKWRMPPLQRAG
jgi:hypothetical protein